MVIYLDCESRESAIDSLCYLFNCTSIDLTALLGKIDLGTVFQDISNSPNYTPDKYVYREAVKAFGVPKKPVYINWFHLTRTCHDNNFHRGILPLGKALEFVWESLLRIFKNTEHHPRLQELKDSGKVNCLYQQKTRNPSLWGPFAMLVKDVAFRANQIGNHDYLRLPEIFEDICNGYREKFGISIHEDVVSSLKPCIVKFRSNFKIDSGCIEVAIFYVYRLTKGEPLSQDANICFDAKGNIIPYEDILSIKYL